jgi:hypothetical protein
MNERERCYNLAVHDLRAAARPGMLHRGRIVVS